MVKTKRDRKEEWEREHVQRVLDYHNKKYETHIKIKGKATDVYPQLEGQLNWDWVCYETETSEEVAVEVKKLTDSKLEEKSNIMWQLLEEVRDSLSGKLPGTFLLSIDIPRDYYLPFNKQGNKHELKRVLYDTIYRKAQKLKLDETGELESQIAEQLSFALPDISPISLYKISDEGSALYKSSGILGVWSRELNELELENFRELVLHANEQLKVTKKEFNVKETFLVIIEEGQRITYHDTVAEAFKHINHDSYSHIDHIYYVSGEEVVGISLEPIAMDTDRQKLELDITQEFEIADSEATLLIDEAK